MTFHISAAKWVSKIVTKERNLRSRKTSAATMVVIRVSRRNSHLVKCLCYRLQLTQNRCLHHVWDFMVFHFFP